MNIGTNLVVMAIGIFLLLIFLSFALTPKDNVVLKRNVAGILSIFFGGLGVGHIYTRQNVRAIFDILFCWTGIPSLIGLVEGLIWLTGKDEDFNEKFNKNEENN